jgi:hypothetical protein
VATSRHEALAVAHDVFISYASEDKPTADAVCAELESAGIRCWIAPRDVLPGIDYSESIIRALHTTRILVLVFSACANRSPHVMREVERAVSRGMPVIPLRIEKVELSPSMEYYISSPHWLDALTPPLKQHLVHLAETVRLVQEHLDTRPAPEPEASGQGPGTQPPPVLVERPAGPPPDPGSARAAAPGWTAGSLAELPARRPRLPVRLGGLAGIGGLAGLVVVAFVAVAIAASGSVGPAATASLPAGGASHAVVAPTSDGGEQSPSPRPTYRPNIETARPAEVSVDPGFAAPGDWVGGLAWDGDNVWVSGGAELFRMDAAGRVLGVFTPPGYSPEGLAWDGSRFWLFTTNDGSIFRFTLDESRPAKNPSVGKVIQSPIRTIGGGANHGLAWHGSGLWLSDFYDLYRLGTDGTVAESRSFGDEVQGVTWDGTRLWIAVNHGPLEDASLMALDADGVIAESYDVPVVEIHAIAWAGDAFFVAGAPEFGGEAMIYRVQIIRPADVSGR